MNHQEIISYWSIVGFEIGLCVLAYIRNLQRRLPCFAAYAVVLLLCTLTTGLIYRHFGFRSIVAYYSFWISIAVSVLARSAAIAELCRFRLQAYRGIWALAWRVLTVMALFLLVHAALDARGQPDWIAAYGLTIQRDIEVLSVVILLSMLLIGDYYRLPIEPVQKWIAVGICFFCLVEIVSSTVLRDLFTKYMLSWALMAPRVEQVTDLWNKIQTFASMVAMSVWCFALRKPLPAPARVPVLLPVEVYQEMSPAINLRLRAFNDRLLEMLKP